MAGALALSAASAPLVSAQSLAIAAKPNDSGDIVIPVSNDPLSQDAVVGGAFSVTTGPAFFHASGLINLPPVPIGKTVSFDIAYSFSGAVDGSYPVRFTFSAGGSPGMKPERPVSALVNLVVDGVAPVVTVNDNNTSAVGSPDVASSDPFVAALGYTNLKGFSVLAADFAPGATADNPIYGSGPGALEAWSGIPGNRAAQRFGANVNAYDAFHEYFSGDPGLDQLNLPDGPAYVVATDQAGNGSTVSFPIGKVPFLVGAQLRSVWQDEARGGLKFRKERRVYRQAGRLLGLVSACMA